MNPCLPPALHRAKGCIHLPDGTCFRTLTAWTWPDEVEIGWLQALYREPVDVTLVFDPIPNDVAALKIGRQHERHTETLLSKRQMNRLKTHQIVDVQQTAEDTLQVVRDLRRNKTRLLRLGLHIRIRGTSHDAALALEERVVRLCRGKTLEVKPESVRLEEGYFQALPLGLDLLQTGQTMPMAYAATTFPFGAGGMVSSSDGILFGVGREEPHTPVLIDRWPRDMSDIVNPHLVTIAQSGGGKTHATCLEIMRTATKAEVQIVDVQGEYLRLTAELGGWIVTDPSDPTQWPPPDVKGPGVVICYAIDPTLPILRKRELMRSTLEAVWNRAQAVPGKKLAVIDEAWEWLRADPELAYLLWQIVKKGRRLNLAVTTITQDVADISKGDRAGGESVLRNARTKMLGVAEADALDDLTQAFHLSDGEREYLESAQRGEFLLIHGRNRAGIKVVASLRELIVVQTSLHTRAVA